MIAAPGKPRLPVLPLEKHPCVHLHTAAPGAAAHVLVAVALQQWRRVLDVEILKLREEAPGQQRWSAPAAF